MKQFLISLIRLYQKSVPSYRRGSCRFYPTCSAYAVEALTGFGVFGGLFLSLWRFLRCNPLSKGGFDPVPERFLFFRRKINPPGKTPNHPQQHA